MIDHIGITVADIDISRKFYGRTLATLGYIQYKNSPLSASFGIPFGFGKSQDPAGDFWLSEGLPMVPRVHFAFSAATPEIVDAFFFAALTAGATENGHPGIRKNFHPHYYAAFVLDPDGYNIEAVCHSG